MVTDKLLKWIAALATTSFATSLLTIGLVAYLIVDGKHETGMKQAENVPISNTMTQTGNTVTVNNGKTGWNLDIPHTINDAAEYLDRTPDTIRSYVPKWIESGVEVEKTAGGMWILPSGFEPYIPE